MKEIWMVKKWFVLLFSVCLCFLLFWCWSKWNKSNKLTVNVAWFSVNYAWNVNLSKVALKEDDLSEIVDLYQEVWDDVWYRDSLLVAQRYSQWLGINAFVQENLDVLENYNLSLWNLAKKQILLERDWKTINAVLVDYDITEWFIPEIPALYISQLFVPDWNMVSLVSFITENSSVRKSMSNAFKEIK